jgi:hypothetical protein
LHLPRCRPCSCVDRCVKRVQEAGPAAATEKAARPVTSAFHALTPSDLPLVEALADFNVKDPKHLDRVATAASRSSFGAKSPAQLVGVLMWLSLYKAVPTRFVMYLKTCYDKELLSEEAVRAWHCGAVEEVLRAVPQGGAEGAQQQLVGAAEVNSLRTSAKPFMDWLDAESEEEGSGSEEEEED